MLPKIIEKLIIRLFDFLSHFTTLMRTLRVQRSIAKRVGRGCSNLTTAMLLLLQPHGAEQLARRLHERCPKHWIDSSRKFQDHLQTQGNKINLNDDYNKNTFIIATTKILMNKNICMYTYSNTVPYHPVPQILKYKPQATSSYDSEYDQSTDSLPPPPKQPPIEQEP